jgi:hypothetical protein
VVLVTDDFNRANTVGPDLGTNWTNVAVNGFAANGFQIVSNAVAPTTLASDKLEFYSGATFASDQYVQAAVTVTATGTAGPGVALRCGTDGTCYRVIVNKAATNNVILSRKNVGATTTLTNFTTTWVDGDTIRAELRGNVFRVFQNGTQLGSDVVDTKPLLNGPPGIVYSSTATSCSMDNWQADDITNQMMRSTTPEFIYIRKNT